MTWMKSAAVAAMGVVIGAGAVHSMNADEKEKKLLGHTVYFTLKDGSKENVAKCVDACKKYLVKHDGVVFFATGVRAPEFDREVNDKEFHVSLHLIFKNKAAHDKYQDHPEHKKFIDECKDMWKTVRVYDDDIHHHVDSHDHD